MRPLSFLLFWGSICMLFVACQRTGLRTNDCFQVKHLDFFGLDTQRVVRFPDADLNQVLDSKLEETPSNINFLLPLLVLHLQKYHPKCGQEKDLTYLKKVILRYQKIRNWDAQTLEKMHLQQQLDFIRADFYQQTAIDSSLAKMIFTFDDGPLYGVDAESEMDLELLDTLATDFGHLEIAKKETGIYLSAWNLRKELLWRKLITGVSNGTIAQLSFQKGGISNYSLASIIHFAADGERFKLYLSPIGRFMFYYHSW